MEQIKRYSLSKQVTDSLEKMIENGRYKIGDKIPTETALIKMFNVSRNTIREAIQSLTSAGLLDVRQGDGTYVKHNNRFAANMCLKLQNVDFVDINDTRKALEITMASLASQRATDEEIELIKNAFMARKNMADNEKEFTVLDINFHMEIAKASHNELLLDLYKSLYKFIYDHIQKRKLMRDIDQEQISKYHEELYLAIARHDSAAAEQYAKQILLI